MGTRGLYGFVVGGEVKAGYNHFDSYPSGLGVDMAYFITEGRLTEDAARALVVVREEDGGSESWYSELRDDQGDPEATLKRGKILDAVDFATDSLFCEWGYLVNFDTGRLEVYRGFQRDASKVRGRFADKGGEDGDYAPITLIADIPFEDVTPEAVAALDTGDE